MSITLEADKFTVVSSGDSFGVDGFAPINLDYMIDLFEGQQ